MKKMWLIPLLILALLLAACADGGVAETPGALGTEPVGLGTEPGALGTEPGLATEPVLATEAIASPVVEATAEVEASPIVEATAEVEASPVVEASPIVEATAEATVGLVAAPYTMFTVADRGQGTGETGTGAETPIAGATTEAGAGTPMAGTPEAAETPMAGTQVAGQTESDMLLVRGSELLGSQIVDMNGETVGTVEEVLVNENGEIQYVVFDATTFMEGTGLGETGLETPIAGAGTEIAGTPETEGTAVTEGTPLAEEGMEGTGVMADEDTMLVFNGTANTLETQGVMLNDEMLDAEGAALTTTGTDMPAGAEQLEGLLRISRLSDTQVMNAQDEELGEVSEWIVNLQQGMVQYGVVDFGGFLGLAENTVAVPWQQFNVNAAAGADANLTLDVTEDTLQNAPQLNTNEWQSWPNPLPTDWETETRTFWETAS